MNEVLALKDEILALVSESATAKDFEKLNMIKGDTIQFIVSNPQYLRQTQIMTGIKYNKTNLIPIKTLINKNVISHMLPLVYLHC